MDNKARLLIIYIVNTMYIIDIYCLVIPGYSITTKNKTEGDRIPLGCRNRVFWGRIPGWIYLRQEALKSLEGIFGFYIYICLYSYVRVFMY